LREPARGGHLEWRKEEEKVKTMLRGGGRGEQVTRRRGPGKWEEPAEGAAQARPVTVVARGE
jgi:hypothetical protein